MISTSPANSPSVLRLRHSYQLHPHLLHRPYLPLPAPLAYLSYQPNLPYPPL